MPDDKKRPTRKKEEKNPPLESFDADAPIVGGKLPVTPLGGKRSTLGPLPETPEQPASRAPGIPPIPKSWADMMTEVIQNAETSASEMMGPPPPAPVVLTNQPEPVAVNPEAVAETPAPQPAAEVSEQTEAKKIKTEGGAMPTSGGGGGQSGPPPPLPPPFPDDPGPGEHGKKFTTIDQVLTWLDELANAREYRLQTVAAEIREELEAERKKIVQLLGGLDWLHTQVPLIQAEIEAEQRLSKTFETDIVRLRQLVADLQEKLRNLPAYSTDERVLIEKIRSVLDEALSKLESAFKILSIKVEREATQQAELRREVNGILAQLGNFLTNDDFNRRIADALRPLLADIVLLKRYHDEQKTEILTLDARVDEVERILKNRVPPELWVRYILGEVTTMLDEATRDLKTRLERIEHDYPLADQQLRTDLGAETAARIEAIASVVARLDKLPETYPSRTEVEGWLEELEGKLDGFIETQAALDKGQDDRLKILEDSFSNLQKQVDELPTLEEVQAEITKVCDECKALIIKKIEDDDKKLQDQITALGADLDALEETVGGIKEKTDKLPEKVLSEEEIQEKIDEAKAACEELIEACKTEILGKITPLEGRVAVLETWQTSSETRLDDHQTRIEKLEKDPLHDDSRDVAIRLARLCLTGWGVVSGLEIKSDDKTDTLKISPGTAVAPDGEVLLERQVRDFTHYKPFGRAGEYKFFRKTKDDPATAVEVWELREIAAGADVPDDTKPLTPKKQTVYPFIHDKVGLVMPDFDDPTVLIYLALRREDLVALMGLSFERCLPNLPVEEDVFFMKTGNSSELQLTDDLLFCALNPSFSLEEIPLFRFGFFTAAECEPDELDDTDFPDIRTIEEIYATWKPIVNEAFTKIDEALETVMSLYHPTLFPQLDAAVFEKKHQLLRKKWEAFCYQNDNLKNGSPDSRYYVQYFYDHARDLIAAWHELRLCLQDLMAAQCHLEPASIGERNRHVLLGPLEQPDQTGIAPPLRDTFRQPPIYNGNAARFETCRLYYRRLFAMIEAFYLEGYVSDTKNNPYCKPKTDDDQPRPDFSRLRITPSKGYIHALSEQAVPYYYPLHLGASSVHHWWNYRRSKTLTVNRILSYHSSDSVDAYSNLREVSRPLYYSLDNADFYRVEGHIGKRTVRLYVKTDPDQAEPKEYKVEEALRYLIEKHNLDFDLRVFRLPLPNTRPPVFDILTENYEIKTADDKAGEDARAFSELLHILGAEHLAGVPKGGTFILILDFSGMAIADFALPYRCCEVEKEEEPPPPPPCSLTVAAFPAAGCTNGRRGVDIVVKSVNPAGNGFMVEIDGKVVTSAPHPYDASGETKFSTTVDANNQTVKVKVFDAVNNSCKNETSFTSVKCPCKITLTAKPLPGCKDMQVVVKLTVTVENPEDSNFKVILDNQEMTIRAYSGATTEFEIFVAGDGKTHTVVVQDVKNPNCRDEKSFTTINCLCNMRITADWTFQPGFNEPTIVATVFPPNPDNKEFNLFYDGQPVNGTPFKYTDSPIKFQRPFIVGTHKVEAVDVLNPECKRETTIEFLTVLT